MNNVRFLRQRYIDPITGKDDCGLIVGGPEPDYGEGIFGEDLQGLPNAGLGSAPGWPSGIGGTPAPDAVGAAGRPREATRRTGAGGAGAGGRVPADGARHGGLGQRRQRRRPGRIGFGSGTGTSMGPSWGWA